MPKEGTLLSKIAKISVLRRYLKNSMFCSFILGGGGRAGPKIIQTNANTNENTGASVTVNSRAPEVPSNSNGEGRSYGYSGWGYKPYHRSGGEPTVPEGQGKIQGKLDGTARAGNLPRFWPCLYQL